MERTINNQTEAQTAFNIRALSKELDELYERIDDAEREGNELQAQHLERFAAAKAGLLDEQREILDRFESEAARHAAERAYALHLENDTLDLY